MAGLKLYIAAPWIDREKMEDITKLFENKGHTITHKWWIQEGGPAYEGAGRESELRSYALKDFEGVANSDVVVVMNTSKSEGKATEQGIALALNKPIIIVGERGKESKNVFHYLENYTWIPTIDQALIELEKLNSES